MANGRWPISPLSAIESMYSPLAIPTRQTGQRKAALAFFPFESAALVPTETAMTSGGSVLPDRTVNCTDPFELSTIGSSQTFLPVLVERKKVRTNGICASQAGFGH